MNLTKLGFRKHSDISSDKSMISDPEPYYGASERADTMLYKLQPYIKKNKLFTWKSRKGEVTEPTVEQGVNNYI